MSLSFLGWLVRRSAVLSSPSGVASLRSNKRKRIVLRSQPLEIHTGSAFIQKRGPLRLITSVRPDERNEPLAPPHHLENYFAASMRSRSRFSSSLTS